MEYRMLGRSGLKVSVYSFGTMTFGGGGFFKNIGNTQTSDAKRQIDICVETGVNLFDTADAYSDGQSEEILGEALGAKRPDVLVATKAFIRMGSGVNDIGSSRYHLIRSCENSLCRLKTDYIDLYQLHHLDQLTPVEEMMRALDRLVRDGKVRYIGVSNWTGWHMMKASAFAEKSVLEPLVSQQIQYSLLHRDCEHELTPCGIDQGIGAIIWGPLASGYLSGKFTPNAAREQSRMTSLSTIEQVATENNRAILAVVREISSERGVSCSQVAMNWVRRKPCVATILIGARNDQQLQDNLAAAEWSLSDAEMARLDEVSAKPLPYPYSMQRFYAGARNPLPGFLPAHTPEESK